MNSKCGPIPALVLSDVNSKYGPIPALVLFDGK